MTIREKIVELTETKGKSLSSRIYDGIMLTAIVIGLLPLMFREQLRIFWYFDLISGLCFVVDYILRWITADITSKKKNHYNAFLIYPFTPMAIIDLLSILPLLNLLTPTFKIVRISRLLKILRVIKFIRYFEPLEIISTVVRRQRNILWTVLSLALFYTFITNSTSALGIRVRFSKGLFCSFRRK